MWRLTFAVLVACGASAPRVHHEYDDLLTAHAPSHDEFGLRAGQGPPDVSRERRALHEDSRPEIRVIALSRIAQSQAEHAIPEYIAALEDPSDDVFAEAASELAEWGADYMDRRDSPEALAALRAHASRLHALADRAGSPIYADDVKRALDFLAAPRRPQ